MSKAPIVGVKFVYLHTTTLEVKETNFEGAVRIAMQWATHKNPILKVVFPTTNKMLYFEDALFLAFLDNELTQQELIERTSCDGLYRNKAKLLTNTKEEIDPGALWMRRNDLLILIYGDDYVTSDFVKELFEEV